MPIFKLEGPDGRIYKFDAPADTHPEALKQALAERLEENPPPPPQGGFFPALKASAAGAQSQMAELGADLGIRSPESAQEDVDALKKYQARTYAPSDKTFTEAPGRHIAEFLGENTPGLAAAVGSGVAGGLPGIAGLLGLQAVGANVSRQHEEGAPLGQANLGAATAAAVPEVLVQLLADRFTPGLRQLLGVSTEAAGQIAKQTARKAMTDYAVSTGVSATSQGAAMAATEALTRLQAGQPTTGDEANQAYGQAAVQGAALGAIASPVGRYIERGQEQAKAAAEDQKKTDATQAALRAQAAQETADQEAYKQTPQYLGETQTNYDAAQKKLEDLKTSAKLVDNTDPNAGQMRADANKAVKDYATSDEFQAARDAYRQAYPRIKQLNAMSGMLTGQQDPLQQALSPELPKTQTAPAVNDVVDRLNADPDAKQRFLNGEITIPGLPAKGNAAVRGALALQDKQQQQQAQQQTQAELAQRQADLQGAANPQVPNTTPGVGAFLDSTEQLQQATDNPTTEVGPVREDGTRRPPYLQGEAPAAPPDIFDNPHADEQFQQALNPQQEGTVPPPEGVAPQARPDFSAVDALYDKVAKGHEELSRDQNASERAAAANRQLEITQARQQLDQYAQGEGDNAKIVQLRDQQEAAVRQMLQSLDELRSGQYLGSPDRVQELGTYKGPGPKTSADERKGPTAEGATPLSNPEQTGGTTKALLLQRAQDAKAAYIKAAIDEANIRRTASGQTLTNDEALKAAVPLNDKLDEIINRLQAKPQKELGWNGQPDSQPRIAPDGSSLTSYTLGDPFGAGPAQLTIKRDKFGKVLRFDAFFKKTGAKQDLLKRTTVDGNNQPRSTRESYGPGTTDANLIQQLLDRGYQASTQDVRPLEQRPFGNVRAALDTAQDDIRQFTRKFVQPERGPLTRVKNDSVIKPQYAPVEAKNVEREMGPGLRREAEFTSNQIDRALGRPDLAYGVRRSLEKAKDSIESGDVSRDLLSASRELAARAFRGERVRERAVMRDLDRAHQAIEDNKRARQPELPGMEPTAFERASARNFENAPQVKQARAALDATKKLTEATAKWRAEKLDALNKQIKELESDHDELPYAGKGAPRVDSRTPVSTTEKQGRIPEQRERFLQARQAAMDAWRSAMRDWHFGEQIDAARKRLNVANDALRRQTQRLGLTLDEKGDVDSGMAKTRPDIYKRIVSLKKEVDAASEAFGKIHEDANSIVDHAEALAKAMQDKNVQLEKQRLDDLEAKLEKVRGDKRELQGAQKDYNEQRAAYTKAQQEAEAARVEFKKRRDAWEAKLVKGLDLTGIRVENGEKIPVGDQKGERPVAEVPGDWSAGVKRVIDKYADLYKQAQEEAAKREPLKTKPVKPERPNTRAAGPVTREKTGGGKNLDEARRRVGEEKTKATDNEVADKLRDQGSITKMHEDAEKLEGKVADMTEEGRALEEKVQNEKDPKEKKKLMLEQRKAHAALAEQAMKLFDLHTGIDSALAEQSAKADKAMKDQKVRRRGKGDKFGQGNVDVVSRKAERSKEKNRVATLTNLKNASEALEKERSEQIGEDYDAFRDIFEGREGKDGLFESKRFPPDLTDDPQGLGESIKPDRSAPYHGMPLAEAAKWAQQNTKDPYERFMFNKLSKMFSAMGKDAGGRVWGGSGFRKGSKGLYNDATHHVVIDTSMEPKEQVQTLLHELVHAATVRGLKADTDFKFEIERLVEAARDYAEKNRETHYGLTDAAEFLAEANSDPEFQDFLNRIPSTYQGAKKSLWSRFVTAVAKLFGLKNASLLTDTLRATESAMELTKKNPNVEGGQVYESRNTRPHSVVFGSGDDASLGDKVKANLGLAFRVQYVDRFGAVVKAIKLGEMSGRLDAAHAFLTNYFIRMSEQTSQMAGRALTYGPMTIFKGKAADGREYTQYKAVKGANMLSVANKVAKAAKMAGWTHGESALMFDWMAVGARANATPRGWERLHAPDNTNKDTLEKTKTNPAQAKAEYQQWMAKMAEHPEAKAVMDDALKEYKQYNDGLIDFVVSTGALSREDGAGLKATPYAPFYRVVGGDVKLFIDNEHAITIGNISDQPDLKEMVGGKETVLPIFTSSVQNAHMLTRMGLRNMATKATATALHEAGFADRIGKNSGPAGPDVIRWKENGENRWATVDSDQYGIPSRLIVMGMEGIKSTIPTWVRLMGGFSNVLRKGVTRSPAYWLRQVVRDPTAAAIGGGLDGIPVLNSLREIAKEIHGGNPEMEDLINSGAINSNIFTGDRQDLQMHLRDIGAGKQNAWTKLAHTLDMAAYQSDAATRVAVYRDALRKGLTPAEAQFRAVEIQNFSRRGLSPGMQTLSSLIPFFNAQVQGLDVLYRTFKNDVPFAEKLKIRQKLATRGALLATTSLAYAAMMSDDPDYRKAKPQARYQNFFMPNPFGEDWIRVPIPFEMGVLFKALPEALFDMAFSDTKVKDSLIGLGAVANTSAPNIAPTAIWPLMGYEFNWSGIGEIETRRERELAPAQRYREATSELAKTMSAEGLDKLGMSPLGIEFLVRNYTGPMGVALMHTLNGLLTDDEAGAKPSKGAADNPMFGALFQRKEGRYLVDRAYDKWNEIVTAQKTYKDLLDGGEKSKAEAYRQDKSNEIAMAQMAGLFRQQMGNMMSQERKIRQTPNLSQEQKDQRLEVIHRQQNEFAQRFFERTKAP